MSCRVSETGVIAGSGSAKVQRSVTRFTGFDSVHMLACHPAAGSIPFVRRALGGSEAKPAVSALESKSMIHLNLPIRRLVTGAILLATCGAVTPSFGRGPVVGEGKPAICGLGGPRGDAPRLVREAAARSVFGMLTIVTVGFRVPARPMRPGTGIDRIVWGIN